MSGSRDRNDLHAPDLNDLQACAVHVDQAADADPGIAVADNPFDSVKRLHREPQRNGGEFGVKIVEHRHQLIARVHAVDHKRHFRLQTVEESPHTRAQRFDAVSDRLGLGDDRLSGRCQFWLPRRPSIEQREAKLSLERIDGVGDGGGGASKTPRGAGEASLVDDREQHQKLVHTWGSGGLHFESPEKNFQIYSDFPAVGANLCLRLVCSHPIEERSC